MNYTALTTRQRIDRILLGSALIVSTMSLTFSPLGGFALLPLVATYPIFAGIYGYDPLTDFGKHQYSAMRHKVGRLGHLTHKSRHA